MFVLPEYVQEMLGKIANDEGLTEYCIESKSGSNATDGFMGALTSVVIRGVRNNNGHLAHDVTLNLLCKMIPEDYARRKEFHLDVIFEREALMYNRILPMLSAFQREKGLAKGDCFLSYPKCYAAVADAATDQYAVIMEDLRPMGFVMWPKRQPPPYDHMAHMVQQLAKLHSVSLALKDQRPADFAELQRLNDLWCPQLAGNGMKNMMNTALDKAVELLDSEEHVRLAKELRATNRETLGLLYSSSSFEPLGVVCHGDCWINNFLFRYEANITDKAQRSKLSEICLLDWQFSRYGPIVCDLCDVLFHTSDKTFRDKHLMNLIRLYHDSLSTALSMLGSDPNTLCVYDDFVGLLKKYGKYILITSVLTLFWSLPDEEDIPNVNEMTDTNATENNRGNGTGKYNAATELLLKTRFNDIFTDLNKFGFDTSLN